MRLFPKLWLYCALLHLVQPAAVLQAAGGAGDGSDGGAAVGDGVNAEWQEAAGRIALLTPLMVVDGDGPLHPVRHGGTAEGQQGQGGGWEICSLQGLFRVCSRGCRHVGACGRGLWGYQGCLPGSVDMSMCRSWLWTRWSP